MSEDPADIRNWQRLDPGTTTSGRLQADDIARLAAIGVRHVIDLSMPNHPEALAGEADLCTGAGLCHTHIPVPFDAPDEADFARFCKAIGDKDGPVHVHCIMNWRVSAFFYRYNRDVRGMAESDARALLLHQWNPAAGTEPHAETWAAFIGLQA